MPQIIETLAEFIKRNGGAPIRHDSGTLLLPSGAAIRTFDFRSGPSLIEAPSDPQAALTAQRAYFEAKLAPAEKDFEDFKAALLGTAGILFRWDSRCDKTYGTADHEDPAGTLTKIANYVRDTRKSIAQIDSQIAALPEVQAEAARRAAQQAVDEAIYTQQANRVVKLRKQVADIEI